MALSLWLCVALALFDRARTRLLPLLASGQQQLCMRIALVDLGAATSLERVNTHDHQDGMLCLGQWLDWNVDFRG